MKKIVFMAVTVIIICVFAISAYADFGELSWKTEEGFLILSQGGSDTPDSFGFAASDGNRTIHLYNIGGSFDKPYAAKLNGLSSAETEIRQFTVTDGEFCYGEPVYVTDGKTVRRLSEIKAELSEAMESVVNPELYRQWERNEIDRIVTDTKAKIQESDRRYAADAAVKSAKEELSRLKTDEQLKEEELTEYRADAIAEIAGFADKSLYRDAEKSRIDEIIAEVSGAINSLKGFADIDLAVADAKSLISALKTDAQYYAEELSELKVSAGTEIRNFADKTLYREEEQIRIDEIVETAVAEINSAVLKEDVASILREAKVLISGLKTDEQLKAEELASAKKSAIAEISGFLDKTLYREAEVAEIDSVISEGAELINSVEEISEIAPNVTEIKNVLSRILTSAQLTVNAGLNAEVITYLEKAVSELEATRFIGNEKKIINIVVPVMKTVVSDGKYGRIVITPEYVKGAYVTQVQNVKELYDKMEPEFEKPAFEQKLAQLDMETQAFLREYFL